MTRRLISVSMVFSVVLLFLSDYLEEKFIGKKKLNNHENTIRELSILGTYRPPPITQYYSTRIRRRLVDACDNMNQAVGMAWNANEGTLNEISTGHYTVVGRTGRESGMTGLNIGLDCFKNNDPTDRIWKIYFRVRLYNEEDGTPIINVNKVCTPENRDNSCPFVKISIWKQNNGGVVTESVFDEDFHDSYMSWDSDGWNTFEAYFRATEEMTGPDLQMLVFRFIGGEGTFEIKDITVERQESRDLPTDPPTDKPTTSVPTFSTIDCSQNFAIKGDGEDGLGQWQGTHSILTLDSPGYGGSGHAFKASNRSRPDTDSGISLWIEKACLRSAPSSAWRIQARAKLSIPTASNPNVETCDPTAENNIDCPFVRVRVWTDEFTVGHVVHLHDTDLHDSAMLWDPAGWNMLDVIFQTGLTNSGHDVSGIQVSFVGGPDESVLWIDDVIISRLETYETPTTSPSASFAPTASPAPTITTTEEDINEDFCQRNFAKNCNDEKGTCDGWEGRQGTEVTTISPGYGGSGYAMKASNRDIHTDGLLLHIDEMCWTSGILYPWRFQAKIKIYNATTLNDITSCNPGVYTTDCPSIQILFYRGDNLHTVSSTLEDPTMVRDTNGWYSFDTIFDTTLENSGPNVVSVTVFVQGGPAESILLVDDLDFTRLTPNQRTTQQPTTQSPTTAVVLATPEPTFVQPPTPSCSILDDSWNCNRGCKFPDGSNHMSQVPQGSVIEASNRGTKAFMTGLQSSLRTACINDQFAYNWHFTAKVKLIDDNGIGISCNPSIPKNCPFLRYLISGEGHADVRGKLSFNENDKTASWDPKEWNEFDATLDLTETTFTEIGYFMIFFWGGPNNSILQVKDINIERLGLSFPTPPPNALASASPSRSSTPTSEVTLFCSTNFVKNGDLELGLASYWAAWGSGLEVVTGFGDTGYALKATGRDSWNRGMAQELDPSCLEAGTTWRFQARVKLQDENGHNGITSCNPSNTTSHDCPMIRLLTRKGNNDHFDLIRAHDMVWDANGWNEFDAFLQMTDKNTGSDVTLMLLLFIGGPENSVLTVDDVIVEKLEEWETPTSSPSISPVPTIRDTTSCERNLVINGDAELESTTGWVDWGNTIDIVKPGFGGTGSMLRASHRRSWNRGIGQWMDTSCLSLNSTWHIKAKVRLTQGEGGPGLDCFPQDVNTAECPMVRLLTKKSDLYNHFHVFRDRDMVWKPDGWSDFDIKVKLTPENSGVDVVQFRPYFVGGAPGSVLLLDDVFIGRTYDEPDTIDSNTVVSKTCITFGDPHIIGFNKTHYENHDIGWVTMYESNKVKVEGYHQLGDPNKNWTTNAGWRVSYDGTIVGEGFNGTIPSNADGTIAVYNPYVIVRVVAHDWTYERFFVGTHSYDIYITTTEHEGAGGLCPDKDQVDQKMPPKPKVVEQTQVEDVCREFEGTILYETCIADLLLIDNMEAFGAIVSATSVTNMTAAKIGDILSEINQDDANSDEDPKNNANTDRSMAGGSVSSSNNDKDDDTQSEDNEMIGNVTRSMNETNNEGDSVTPLQTPGVNGDPLIVGFQKQAFNFDGKSDAWYANLATKLFQWNMKFHYFPNCDKDESMYVTGLGMSINKTKDSGGSHDIMISVLDEGEVFPGCSSSSSPSLCLGDGSLQISVNGATIVEPGDYRLNDEVRIIAHNTFDACSRKWFDFGTNDNVKDEDDTKGAKKTKKGSTRGARRLNPFKTPLAYLRESRKHMINPAMCSHWLKKRTLNDDLFLQLGGWSSVYVETPNVSFKVEYRQVQKGKCKYHLLDAWMTHASPEIRQEKWHGILGETRELKLTKEGEPILDNRNLLLSGNDDSDYEVDGPFGRDFKSHAGSIEQKGKPNNTGGGSVIDTIDGTMLIPDEDDEPSSTGSNNNNAQFVTKTGDVKPISEGIACSPGKEFTAYVRRTLEPWPWNKDNGVRRKIKNLWKERLLFMKINGNWREAKVLEWVEYTTGPYASVTDWTLTVELYNGNNDLRNRDSKMIFSVGDRVQIRGLQNSKEHNGKEAIIASPLDSNTGRYGVYYREMGNEDTLLAVRPLNLYNLSSQEGKERMTLPVYKIDLMNGGILLLPTNEKKQIPFKWINK